MKKQTGGMIATTVALMFGSLTSVAAAPSNVTPTEAGQVSHSCKGIEVTGSCNALEVTNDCKGLVTNDCAGIEVTNDCAGIEVTVSYGVE